MVYAIICFSIFVSLYLFLILPTKWLKIERVDTDLGLGIKAIQISDLHIRNLRVDLTKLKKVIEKEKPDYLFLTGDYIDRDERELPMLEDFLSTIERTGVKTFAVLGNHDRYLKDVERLISIFEKYHIKILRNESIEFEDFHLIGIDDYCKGFHNVQKSFESVDTYTEKKKIIITHDPNIICDLDREFHILLSGHLHGKQINIPFLFHLKPMGTLPKTGIYKGLNRTEKGCFYISKGIGQSRYNIRFMVRSEITVHRF